MNINTYVLDGNIYINLTNKCSNDCTFCVRNHPIGDSGYFGYNLWLDNEATAEEIISELEARDVTKYKEVVFCGYGEPTYRYEDIKKIADYVHSKGGTTRINTNGQARLILGEDITKDFHKYIDIVNVSLNATDAKKYQDICKSVYGEAAFDELIDFAKSLVGKCKRVILSVVDCIGEEEIAKARKIAEEINAELRVREEL